MMQTMEIRRDIIGVLKEWKDMPGRKLIIFDDIQGCE